MEWLFWALGAAGYFGFIWIVAKFCSLSGEGEVELELLYNPYERSK